MQATAANQAAQTIQLRAGIAKFLTDLQAA
jgi:hypothetical protein